MVPTDTLLQVVRAIVGGDCIGCGRGSTKKAAKNEAAKEGLVKMGVDVVRPSSHSSRVAHIDLEEQPV